MKISKRQLRRIIREEAAGHWGGDAHDYKRDDGHKSGDVGGHYKDFEGPEGGNKGDESKTDPSHLDYDGSHGDVEHKAKTAMAAIQDLASAAGVELDATETTSEDPGTELVGVAMESRRRLKSKLRRIVRETRRRLNEDEIDTELDRLHKNIKDDIDHIKDLKRDIEDDKEEESRAEDAEARKDEAVRRRIKRIIRSNTRRR